MKRNWVVGAAWLLFSLLMMSLAQDTIKIGAAFNVTGGYSSLDAPALNGARLAVKEINAAGGLLGQQIELIEYDGKSDPATVATVAAQVIEGDKVVGAVGFADSDMALAFGPIAQTAGVPFITGGTSPQLPSQLGNTVFLALFGDNVQAAAGADYALGELGAKTAYLLIDTSAEYTNLLGAYFKDAFANGGGEIVLEDTYKNGDTSFAAQITKVKALETQPDVLYISALPDDIGTVVKQFRQAGLMQPILGGDGYDTPLLIEVAGEAANDVYFTTHALMDPQNGNDAVKAFSTAYKTEYGIDPENSFAAFGYDAVKLLADGITRANSAEPAAIIEALDKTSGLALVTGVITYVDGNHVPQKTVSVIGVKDQKLFSAAEIVPEYIPAP
jgi:branched-chain amino acid transport system substrate-binding protein